MSDLGKAYVQIVPSAEGVSGAVSGILNKEAGDAGEKAGLKISSGLKKVIAAAGIGAAVTKSLEIGGNLQQSFGGLDTLYGEAAEAAKKYAAEAYKAGVSTNTYAEQAVSFGAALKQAYGGDTTAAMEAANTAIMDMTDNAAKMGTPIESVQQAYQGFAKGQYTLLDNLKLGYGGTKGEMERLLADAQKLSGVEYDIDNLGDVYDAIHVIQEDLGLTGVAAQEAAETFSGSFGAMKAAAENLLGNIMLGENVESSMSDLVTTASTFLINNLIPAVGRIIISLPGAVKSAIETAVPIISDNFSSLWATTMENAPDIIESAKNTIIKFGTGIVDALPELGSKAGEIISTIVNGIGETLPQIASAGGELLGKLSGGIIQNLPEIGNAILKVGSFIITNLGKLAITLVKSGLNLVTNIAKGIISGIASAIGSAMQRVKNAITEPIEKAKEIIRSAIERIKSIINNAHLSLPRFKLPHFSISGGEVPWGIGGKGTKPSISVEWYRKAENQPYMFDRSVLFGAGERNDEILYGHASLMRDIREATAGSGSPQFTFYNTINGAEDPEGWGRKMISGAMLELRAL